MTPRNCSATENRVVDSIPQNRSLAVSGFWGIRRFCPQSDRDYAETEKCQTGTDIDSAPVAAKAQQTV